MKLFLKNISKALLVLPVLLIVFDSCKKDETPIEPIVIEGVENKLAGTWNVISTTAVGSVNVLGADISASGENVNTPEGFYELKKSPNTYTYDLKTKLEIKADGTPFKQNYDYDDHDAGTWSVSEDEKSVIFAGNQGITQTLFFTQYDSNETQFMNLAIPVDTTLNGFDYKGTIFLKMTKNN